MNIGVLALQGAFAEHLAALRKLGANGVEIRQRADFHAGLDGIILPGGESTVMGKLLRELELYAPIRDAIAAGMPVLSTCAGLILLAERAENNEKTYFALMDITVRRNAYGRQLGSFRTTTDIAGIGPYPMVFIRAPFISSVGPKAHVLATVDGHVVAARQQNMLATAFHPELTDDLRVHSYFINMIAQVNANCCQQQTA
ncbi:pyridoxal 5'-phosphate synthase glutaminase subunit PdxT [Oligosphaera ethanolica]|uniref:Pyridoxal 5'-phosphate synthase subunit PdxT n=1 Tax=Oligosphaera ethanolica TaxID=760260 RepID=A0AAE3VJ93_9BACT|nr:pyridoxal 5'-phosphate synthase glutaminase subunit PdxT [Oligosphaera ethanolica]MDQ0291602.1 5'-phosphate synthase pdxT subunit [Oligosphaera ethanolica]